MYSSNMEDSAQCCTLRRQPTRQPVLCLLVAVNVGWQRGSRTAASAAAMPSSGISTKVPCYRACRTSSCAMLVVEGGGGRVLVRFFGEAQDGSEAERAQERKILGLRECASV